MFLIKANISFTDAWRKAPIMGHSYRPLLFFSDTVIRSGLIVMENGEQLDMTGRYEDRLIKIYFYEDLDTAREFHVGRRFSIREGAEAVIGEGIITAVIGEEKA